MSGLTLQELVSLTGHPRRYMRAAVLAMEAEGCVQALPDGSYALVPGALDPEVAEALARLTPLPTADGSSGVRGTALTPLGWARRRIMELVA